MKVDCVIVGLGAMGSAAAFELARRGLRVLGLDRFTPPHSLGSSHGGSRIIREAYWEHPSYVPLLRRAYERWRELEQLAGESLLRQTGGLMIGPAHAEILAGSIRSAREYGIPHETLSARELTDRFPAFAPAEPMQALLETRAGILAPEKCVAAHLRLAAGAGAELGLEEPVLAWRAERDGFVVQTAQREVRTAQLVFTAGGWVSELLPNLRLPFRVERQLQFWFQTPAGAAEFGVDQCPIFLCEFADGRQCYGFPDLGEGWKIALHNRGEVTTADSVNRVVDAQDEAAIRDVLRGLCPRLADAPVRTTAVCFYTTTPDGHFWIDRHPEHRGLHVISPCSGHGFKFASVLGEVVADLVTRDESRFDLSLFRARP